MSEDELRARIKELEEQVKQLSVDLLPPVKMTAIQLLEKYPSTKK